MSVRPPGSGISGVTSTGPLAHPEQPAKLETPESNDQNRQAEGKQPSAIASDYPQMSVRKPAESPLTKPSASPKPVADEPASQRPSWVETVPLDVRLKVLNEVAKQPSAEAAQQDFASYAQTSKSAQADVREYHRLARDPRASLLASKNLARDAWQTAKQNWFGKAEAFQSALKSAVDGCSAVQLDGRYGIADFADYTPAAVSAVMASNIDHLHLKIGYPDYRSVLSDQGVLDCIKALGEGCVKRLSEGKSLPSIFLYVDGVPIKNLSAALKGCPVSLSISGLSVCSHRSNAELELKWPSKSVREVVDLAPKEASDLESWSTLFGLIKGARYLHLSGWDGNSPMDKILGVRGPYDNPLGKALKRFIRDSNCLEELHLPMNQVTFRSFISILTAISKKPSFKCLATDYLTYTRTSVLAPLVRPANLLKGNPNLIYVDKVDTAANGANINPVLEPYRLEGRYLHNGYPQSMRDLPEIYSKVDFFKPAS